MALKGVLHFAIVLCCLSYYGEVEGGNRKLTRKEDLEIEEQLKLLDKPVLKTINTESGDIYDCIDFYKQPAFDHPLLKNHTYHFESRHISPSRTIDKETAEAGEPLEIGLQGEGCPSGTVPIRRTTKEDLIKAKLFTETYASRFNPLGTVESPGLHRAIIRTKPDPTKNKYNGGGALISVYQPRVTGSQYSSAQITIQGGSDIIQVGWTVNPSLYGDSKSRLLTFFKAGASSCFDTRCPGFVITGRIPLGVILKPVSTRGGPIYDLRLFVYRDQITGNWWLEVGKNHTKVGFWPRYLFSGLKDLATYVEWGGEVYSPVGQPGPEMGSGYPLIGETNFDAFCKLVQTVNEAHEPKDAENTEKFSDDVSYYEVDDWGLRAQYGHVITFGGPGPS